MTLIILFGVSLGLNLLMYVIAYIFQTDKLTDISYSVTFLILSMWAFSLSDKSIVALVSLLLIAMWACRLGGYLLIRIKHMGHDARFDSIRINKWSFLGFWFVQGISVFIISLSYLLHMVQGYSPNKLTLVFGSIIALSGWLIEAVADQQKYIFKKKRPDAFMAGGLWSIVRHPNYLGEIMFWFGLTLLAWGPNMTTNLISLIGPLWITFLLLKFSGIPILEKTWQKKYGENPKYKKYKASTSKLIPGVY